MERQGYVYTVAGLGCFAASMKDIKRDEAAIGQLTETLRSTLRQLTYLGFTKDETAALLEQVFREEQLKAEEMKKGSERV